jgi:phenylalanyl-tRNA synthetase alpha chain
MVELREHEQRTLLALGKLNGKVNVDKIVATSGLAHSAVMRAALSLEAKQLVKMHEQRQTSVVLTREGEIYAQRGLPERETMNIAHQKRGEISISSILRETDIPEDAIPIALAWLMKKNWATINKKEKTIQLIKKQKPPRGSDEKLLALLAKKGVVVANKLDKNLQQTVHTLERRKLVETKQKTVHELELTKKALKLIGEGLKITEEVSQLTPELIITRRWKQTKLRRFNVTAPGPTVYPGKIHPLQQMIQRVREIFLEMGFTEIRGPIVETAFWNFDALFQPQDHPAREMMDTFYLKDPQKGELPNKKIVDKVSETHENGWVTGSKGWQYSWSADEAKKLILRTHTTAETIRHLSEHNKPPVKVFSVDRIYRNERLDYQHLAELHQIEGIVMDKDVTLRDLMGTLKQFYLKLGLRKVQFWPGYFPYTEPSVEATVYVAEIESWIELCGMGMFRPEVLAPFGIEYPVLAWGGGLERLAMVKLGLEDIRYFYKNDLEWIRRASICQQ